MSTAMARGMGTWMAQTQRDQRAIVNRHVRRVMGREASGAAVRRAVDHAFESYAAYWLESFRLPDLSAAEVAAGLYIRGYEHVVEALARGNGVILALPHLGGWEWA